MLHVRPRFANPVSIDKIIDLTLIMFDIVPFLPSILNPDLRICFSKEILKNNAIPFALAFAKRTNCKFLNKEGHEVKGTEVIILTFHVDQPFMLLQSELETAIQETLALVI